MIERLKIFLRRLRDYWLMPLSLPVTELHDLVLREQTAALQHGHPNPLNRAGRKVFSQTDEDGITFEILRRLDIGANGTYAEFGVGDGLENNTLSLAALGMRGYWVGGQQLAFDPPEDSRRFRYYRSWITLDNIVELARKGMQELGAAELDVLSLDLDGNDLYFVEALLAAGIRPKLFIVEYNAKFPPPIEFTIGYDAKHTWKMDDYFGASLASFAKLFAAQGYRLVCCNSHSGSNAFFVQSQFDDRFSDVPVRIEDLYVAPRYHRYKAYGHRASPRTALRVLGSDSLH